VNPLQGRRFGLVRLRRLPANRNNRCPTSQTARPVHEVKVINGDTMITESTEAPNLPSGLTVNGHL
jgi:hypothetical protein